MKIKTGNVCHFISAHCGSIRDATRAFLLTPYLFHRRFEAPPSCARLPFRQVLKQKRLAFRRVYHASLEVRLADQILICHLGSEGLLANILHLLEVLMRVPPTTRFSVSWKLTAGEVGFRYGSPGQDVFEQLFAPIGVDATASMRKAEVALDLALWGNGKDRLKGLNKHIQRHAYNRVFLKWLKIVNERILRDVEDICKLYMQNRFCIGVHRRTPNKGVANCQSDGEAPDLQSFIKLVRKQLADHTALPTMIFLATDDILTVDAFKDCFTSLLHVREDVQRTTAYETEVHYRAWGQLSVKDAEDVLIDTLLLSKCDVLIHASSSVSTVASFINPHMRLIRAT